MRWLSQGYSSQLMLARMGRVDHSGRWLESGWGLAWLATVFWKVLAGFGVDDATWQTLMFDNPEPFLNFEP